MTMRRKPFGGALGAIALAGASLAGSAAAAAEPARAQLVEIGAMSLDDALHALARQTTLQLLYSKADVQGLQAPPVRGAYTPREALSRMLEGTGLIMEMRSPDTAVIRRGAPPPARLQPVALRQPAPAETAAAPPAAAASPPQVQEVIVTARRRSEEAQRVPIAITTLSGTAMQAAGVTNITTVQQLAPSLQVTQTNPRSTNINIRGIGSSVALTSPGLDNGVGIYVDQVYYGRSGQATFDLADIAQVEVLRGPQGTLFGKNTTGGAINITTQAPTFTPEAFAQVEYGNYRTLRALGSVSGPLVADKLAGRLTVAAKNRDKGFLFNTYNGTREDNLHDLQVRGQLLATPSEALSVRLIGDWDRQSSRCCQGVTAGYVTTRVDGTPLPNNFFVRAARAGLTVPPVDPGSRRISLNTPAHYYQEQWGVTGIADWRLDGATITSVTAYRHWNWWPFQDADSLPLDVFREGFNTDYFKQFSQELRIASSDDKPISYVAGLYYYYQHLREEQHLVFGSDAPLWILGSSTPVSQAALAGFGTRGLVLSRARSYAAFAQLTWHATSQLSVTGGLRYTYERKSGSFSQVQAGGVPLSTLPAAQATAAQTLRNTFGAPVAYDARLSQGKLSGQINVAYQFTPTIMAYATYAKGFKAGGLNLTQLPPSVAPVKVAPENVDDYELGVKATLFERRLVLNAAAFWLADSNYQNSQINLGIAQTAFVANAGKVRSRGFELDARAVPVQGLSLYASGAYDDAVYQRYTNAPCPIEYLNLRTICDLSGRPLPGVSKYSVSAGGEYSHPLALGAGDTEAYLGVDYSYRSSFYAVFNDAAATRVPGYSLVNLRLGLRTPRRWDAYFFMRNAFDKDYAIVENLGAFNSGSITERLGDPRTYGVGFRASF